MSEKHIQLPAAAPFFGRTRLTFDHVNIVGAVADAHGDRVCVFPDKIDNISLLSGGDTAAQHRLALSGQFHKGGAPLWSLVQLCLEST